LYNVINRANIVIHNGPVVEDNPSLRERMIGEARFLRAWAYYELVSLWGPVPVYLEPIEAPDQFQPRISEEQVYDQIITDLGEAAEALHQTYQDHARGIAGEHPPDPPNQLPFAQLHRLPIRDSPVTSTIIHGIERRPTLPTINTMELEGISEKSWGEAAREALREAARTIRHINKLEVLGTSTEVDDNQVVRYRTQVRLYFEVEQER
jgi:flavin-binding protein dodecin